MIHSESEILVGVSPILNLNLLLECQNLLLEIKCQKSKLNGKIYYLKFYHIECQIYYLNAESNHYMS